MTPEELRLKIAALKGWKHIETTPSGKVIGTNPYGVFYATVPNWPASIEAAWELWEEMRAAPGAVNIQGDYAEKGYVCYFRTYPTTAADTVAEWGETAPLAICAAWVAWKEITKNEN